MPRRARVMPGGLVCHVLNRTVAVLPRFRKQADYEAFERIIVEAHERHPVRILVWCLMRNHWHFVVWPRAEGEVTAWHLGGAGQQAADRPGGGGFQVCLARNRPYGSAAWQHRQAKQLGLLHTLRRFRPGHAELLGTG